MSSPKGRILRMLGGVVLREGEVVAVDAPAPRFRRLRLRVAPAAWEPGDKVQCLLPTDDVRTYTPIGWGAETELLAFLHGATPAAAWARAARPGDRLRFVGPQRSLSLPEGAVGLVGDETSLAIAAAWSRARPGGVRVALAAQDPVEVREVAAALGLAGVEVVARAAPDVGERLAAAVAGAPTVGITGEARLVVAARAALRALGVEARVKTYWAPGKVGLD